jgi:KEOPS complex subunit Pcc1
MSAFSASIVLTVNDKAKAIFDSITTDNKFYPENQTKVKIIRKKNQLHITIEASELSQLRANINSILRLTSASYDSIKSLEL